MEQKIRAIVFTVIGIVAIILAVVCYTKGDLDYASNSMYGGDAYTGIQNAAAQTSKNVKEQAAIIKFGFGSILLVMGLTLVGIGVTTPMSGKKEELTSLVADAAPKDEVPQEIPVDDNSKEVETEAIPNINTEQ